MKSPNMSFKGFSLWTLIARNKDTIKLLIAFIAGFSYFNGFQWGTFLLGIGSLVAKMLADTLDFYFSEVELK